MVILNGNGLNKRYYLHASVWLSANSIPGNVPSETLPGNEKTAAAVITTYNVHHCCRRVDGCRTEVSGMAGLQ